MFLHFILCPKYLFLVKFIGLKELISYNLIILTKRLNIILDTFNPIPVLVYIGY